MFVKKRAAQNQELDMQKKDLIDFSPAKLLSDITDGGLKEGSMGLLTSKKGLGKTSVLVQLALGALIADKQVVHVSFDQHSSYVISWYDSVLNEIAKKRRLGETGELSDDVMRERIILNFNQETFSLPKVTKTITALKEGGINVSMLVIDGADMTKIDVADLKVMADFVRAQKMTAWFSGNCEEKTLDKTFTSDKTALFDIVAHLASDGYAVVMSILKGGSGSLKLDSKTLLMVK